MEYLAERGLPIYGSKAEKMKRLLEGKKKKKKAAKQPKKTDNPLAGLPPGAEWVLLNPAPEPVPEPENVDLTLRPPSELEAKKVNPRYEYSETFDRVPFTGTDEFLPRPPEKKQCPEGRKKKARGISGPRNVGRTERTPQIRTEGGPNMAHVKRCGLGLHSLPMDWFVSLVPLTPADNLYSLEECDAIGDGKTKFCASNFTRYTNLKAELVGAGEPGRIYEGRWKPFTDRTTNQCLGLLTLDGLCPVHQMRRRVVSQKQSKLCGNDEIARIMGPNAALTWQLFRTIFACQDPLVIPPPREECPNYKMADYEAVLAS